MHTDLMAESAGDEPTRKAGRSDATGAAPDLLWPDCLILPARPPKLVYLDLNHWIGLAKAATGHRDGGRYAALLDASRTALARGTARFVLSDTIYFEMYNIADPRQRRDIAVLMEELTQFQTLLGRPAVMRLELQMVIEQRAGRSAERYGLVDLVGHGFQHAMGLRGGVTIRNADGADLTEDDRNRAGAGKLDSWLREADLGMQRAILAGPQDNEVAELRDLGYAPEKTRAIAQQRADQERALTAKLDADTTAWRRGRLRDVIGARELCIEMLDMIDEQLTPRGLTIGSLVDSDRSAIRAFARCMPGAEISIEMKTQYHKNKSRSWTVNDVHDIDALALAVPYCDVVFTDAAARNALVAAKIDARMQTSLPRRPDELATQLEASMPSA